MNDIVERLYNGQVCSIQQNYCPNQYLMEEAADEIERLRAEREALRKQVASVEIVMKEVRGWANDAGSTKTPRGRTLNAVLRRLRDALKGKQEARALLQKGK